jgi:hypothetical protein
LPVAAVARSAAATRAAYAKEASKKYGHLADRGADVVPEIGLPTTEQIKKATGADAYDYTPQTWQGRYLKSTAEMVPGAALGGGRTVGEGIANLARYAVAPGVASQAVGDLAGNIDPKYEAPPHTAGTTPRFFSSTTRKAQGA